MFMKQVVFIFLCLFNSNLHAQFVSDQDNPQNILDILRTNNDTIQMDLVGTCNFGLLSVKNELNHSLYSIQYYILDGHFDYDEDSDQWLLMMNMMPGDDFGGKFIKIISPTIDQSIYINHFGDLSGQDNVHFSDFTIFQDSLILFAEVSNQELIIINKEGEIFEKHPYETYIEFVDYRFHNIYLFDDNRVVILDEEFQDTLHSIELDHNIKQYQWKNNQLFIEQNESIVQVDSTLNFLYEYSYEDNWNISDFKIENNQLHLINVKNNVSEILSIPIYSSAFEKTIEENYDHLEFNAFVDGINNNLVHGHQDLNISGQFQTFTNGIVADTATFMSYENDYAIEFISRHIQQEIWEEHIEGMDTLYTYIYNQYLEYEILNFTDDTIKNCFVGSDKTHWFNCAHFSYRKKWDQLNIAPNESLILLDTFVSYYSFSNPLTLYLVGANGKYDTQIDNNTSTHLFVTTENPKIEESFLVFPNPTRDHLRITSNNPLGSIKVFNSHGMLMEVLNDIDKKEIELNTNDYPPGVYFILNSKDRNESSQKMFIKL